MSLQFTRHVRPHTLSRRHQIFAIVPGAVAASFTAVSAAERAVSASAITAPRIDVRSSIHCRNPCACHNSNRERQPTERYLLAELAFL